MKFKGYKRADGRAGVRNFVVVIPSVFCANKVALTSNSMIILKI